MGVGGCVCSSYGKFSENRHYSSKIRGNACSSGDPQLIVYNLQQSISDSDMNSSLSQKGRDLHHCQWCKCPQRHCWALAATSASQHCSLLLQVLLLRGEMPFQHKLDMTGGQRPTALFRCRAPVTVSRNILENSLNFQTTHTHYYSDSQTMSL